LLSELTDAYGVGTDISELALQTAHSNANDLGLADRASFVACDYAATLSGPFDLIVANPPYIRSADIGGLAREVRDHDPLAALDGGADGLDAYRALIRQAAPLLELHGALVVEVGQGQSGDVEDLMKGAGLIRERPAETDLAGIDRAVAARKPPP
jgi:release factor glutamine methyltransferase